MMNEVQIKDQAIRDLSLLLPNIYSSRVDSFLLLGVDSSFLSGFSYER